MGRQSRFADGIGSTVRRTNGRGVPRLRISALRYPLLERRRGRNRQFGRKPAGMRRAATLPHATTHARRRNTDAEVCTDDSPPSCPRLSRASTPCLLWTKEGVDGRDKPGHDERWVLAERTRELVLAKRTRGRRRSNDDREIEMRRSRLTTTAALSLRLRLYRPCGPRPAPPASLRARSAAAPPRKTAA
jgi:hypothetical protein